MEKKHILRHILAVGVLLWCLLLCGCRREALDTLVQTTSYPVSIEVKLPPVDAAASVRVQDKSVLFNDLNMGKQYAVAPDSIIWTDSVLLVQTTQPVGFYDVEISVTLLIDGAENLFRSYLKSFCLAEPQTVTAEATIVKMERTFVLAEIFTPGTQTPEGKTYVGDRYFVIYNNSGMTLYADGLVLLESKLKNTQKYTLEPDFRSESFAADAIYRIPGDGTQYPVQAGGSLLIVDNAMDHREANKNSFDLSDADFEWYDQSTNASVTDIDNPDVPNLDKIFCYSLTIWIPNSQGNTSFALARFPDSLSTENYLMQYKFHYDYTNVTSAGTFKMSADTYLVPNEWIIDAVSLCPRSAYQWTAVAPELDGGYTYVGELGSDKTRYGKSVRRKTLYTEGTRRILQDTNNSTYDFLPAQTADPHYFANQE